MITNYSRTTLPQTAPRSGMALIVVLMLLAILTVLASQLTVRLQQQIRRAENQQLYTQAYWYAMSSEALAISVLNASLSDEKRVHLGQPWAVGKQRFPLDQGSITTELVDMQSCFNLNAFAGLKHPEGSIERPLLAKQLLALLSSISINDKQLDNYQAEVITDSVWEFVDTNSTVDTQYGVEDSHYLGLPVPYLAPNTLLADISELRAVNGVDATIYQAIVPYVCALPEKKLEININTLTEDRALLLQALFTPHLSLEQAKRAIGDRPRDGWIDVQAFLNSPIIAGLDPEVKKAVTPMLTVNSHYFLLTSHAQNGRIELTLRSGLAKDKKESTFYVLRHQLGEVE
ncbi:MAG: type II secretion system minor pseudopilin GspK [Plesiomonas sp.]|uniref:type II secretion system minor pseudopilin GspK n=1 Tax=Plesiomonas sp. TaxID=2486279 RepID=UPI003F315E08